MRRRTLIILGLACLALGRYPSAQAGTILSFDSSSYNIRAGQTVPVEVFFSLTSGSSPIGGLVLAEVQVTFNNPSGIAAVLSAGNITGNPLFDVSQGSFTSTQASVVDVSLNGVSTNVPVLLGTFIFTGLKQGTTQISASAIPPPGMSFATTTQATIPDPTLATATINVVPEPASLIIVLTGGPFLIGGLALRRKLSSPRHSRAA